LTASSSSNTTATTVVDDAAVNASKCAYINAKTNTEVQTVQNLRTKNLQNIMESSAFASLPQATQDRVTKEWIDSAFH
jgi:hypothetical protein